MAHIGHQRNARGGPGFEPVTAQCAVGLRHHAARCQQTDLSCCVSLVQQRPRDSHIAARIAGTQFDRRTASFQLCGDLGQNGTAAGCARARSSLDQISSGDGPAERQIPTRCHLNVADSSQRIIAINDNPAELTEAGVPPGCDHHSSICCQNSHTGQSASRCACWNNAVQNGIPSGRNTECLIRACGLHHRLDRNVVTGHNADMARCTDTGRNELCLEPRTYGFPLAICRQEHLIFGDILRLPLRHRLIRDGLHRGLYGLKFQPRVILVLWLRHQLETQLLALSLQILLRAGPILDEICERFVDEALLPESVVEPLFYDRNLHGNPAPFPDSPITCVEICVGNIRNYWGDFRGYKKPKWIRANVFSGAVCSTDISNGAGRGIIL